MAVIPDVDEPSYALVVPTVGRASLSRTLASVAASGHPMPLEIVVVDDRADDSSVLPPFPEALRGLVSVVRSGGRGPAAARNAGWRATTSEWVVFLDDDVVVTPGWARDLADDLLAQGDAVGGVQGRIEVPLPDDRRPTDWERGTARLATASWITADMAYRREALIAADGFDERFPHAYREDSDLALRVLRLGWRLVVGRRVTQHPVRTAPWWASAKQQAGNADDVLMGRLHGPGWREAAQAAPGARRQHVASTGLLLLAAGSLAVRRPRAAALAASVWAIITASFAARRIAPGPRDAREVAAMVVTSIVIPPLATLHWLRGLVIHRGAGPAPSARAVLFDRDGTLIHDVPYNGDPSLVSPVDDAAEVVASLRARGIRVGVVSNQSGVGRGLISASQLRDVNAAVDHLVGPFDVWAVCPHTDEDGCPCRKPSPGLVVEAARELGLDPSEVVVIGDIGADVEAAARAGARSVLVPTPRTLAEEVAAAPVVAADLREAVRLAIGPETAR